MPPRSDNEFDGPDEPASAFPVVITLVAAAALNFMVLANISLPVLRPAAGFWFLILLPSYLLITTSAWRRCSIEERLGYSICATLLILMLVGLTDNEILPLIGLQRPLDADPVLIIADLINLSLFAFRSRYPERSQWRGSFAAIGKEELRLLVMASLCVALVVFGANRLNNGAGGQPTLLALGMVALVILFALRWMGSVRESVISIVIYLISLSLLLSTSLRGWYITGHDIQDEYRVFQLTEGHGHWSMAYYHNAYNACLSITILPTELGQLINVDSPYVYKVFFQMIFAIGPVLAYGISRRYFGRRMSMLSVAYFVGFPTFFTDMPFLNRQEIGLLFVAAGVLAATNPVWSLRRRQLALVIAGVGVEISHYSSMYVFVGVLVIAWLCRYCAGLLTRPFPSWLDIRSRRIRWAPGAGISITAGLLVVFAGVIILWGGLATGTSGQALNDGESFGAGGFSLNFFESNVVAPSVALSEYRQETLKAMVESPAGTFLPVSAVAKAATPIVSQQLRPLTTVGKALSSAGIPVVSLNSLARDLVAYCEEMFLAVGLLRLLLVSRRGRRPIGQQLYWLSIGSVVMIGLITVLPSLSAEYGPLRAFQEGLIFFAPIVVLGSETLLRPLFRRRASAVAVLVWLGLFVNTSGLVPQILGGNLAELNLNNSGTYYNLYYMNPEDEAAVTWLGEQPNVLAYSVQSPFSQSKFLFAYPPGLTGKETISDAYPTIVSQSGWVMMGYPTIGTGLAYSFIPTNGDLLEYKYPLWLLNDYKNLVYTNGKTVIYK